MKHPKTVLIRLALVLAAAIATSCGGSGYGGGDDGGGGGAATLNITIDPDSITLGESATITWSSNGNRCTASGDWSGDKSGDVVWTPEADEVFKRIKQDLPMEGATTETVDPTPNPSVTDSGEPSSEPTVSATPKRQTEKEILAECDLDS